MKHFTADWDELKSRAAAMITSTAIMVASAGKPAWRRDRGRGDQNRASMGQSETDKTRAGSG